MDQEVLHLLTVIYQNLKRDLRNPVIINMGKHLEARLTLLEREERDEPYINIIQDQTDEFTKEYLAHPLIIPGDLAALKQSYEWAPTNWEQIYSQLQDKKQNRGIKLC